MNYISSPESFVLSDFHGEVRGTQFQLVERRLKKQFREEIKCDD
jgi:hypothetical protein